MTTHYSHFIGIDIGKFEFVVNIHGSNKTYKYSNDMDGLRHMREKVKSILPNALVILETTGGHERLAIAYLQKRNVAVHRANTRQVKNFIRSYGILGKTDDIDAIALSAYGAERHASLKLYEVSEYDNLRALNERRSDLVKMRAQEKNRKQSPSGVCSESFDVIMKVLEGEIEKMEEQMEAIVESSPTLKLKIQAMKTVPGIGDVTAKNIIAIMPEIGSMNQKQVASLAGVAPHPNQSGTKQGYRRTRGGRRNMRPVLFIAALSAIRSKSVLGEFYERLLASGKTKMCAIVAVMRKMIVIANARVKEALVQA